MMEFVYKNWDDFCKKLRGIGIQGTTAFDVYKNKALDKYVVLKHDVETKVQNAYEIAKIENKYGHKSSFYVQAYLLDSKKNIALLKKIQLMGHEVSYHHDVMDSCKGDLELAIDEFNNNLKKFENLDFKITTVCQHGNPIIERSGYTSNRDFFRSSAVQNLYPNMADIMVDFKEKANTDYQYISDAGRKFNIIYDPINNDIINSNDKNIAINDFDSLLDYVAEKNSIISIHPHRWVKYTAMYKLQGVIFSLIRAVAKAASKIPLLNKIMGRFYYLSKKL